VTLGELRRGEGGAEVVGRYLNVVDEALFHGSGKPVGERGWERERRRVLEKDVKFKSLRQRRDKRRASSSSSGVDGGEVEKVGLGLHLTGDAEGRRVSMIDIVMGNGGGGGDGVGGMQQAFSEEPGMMMGAIREEDEDCVDEDELPVWARKEGFEHELGMLFCISLLLFSNKTFALFFVFFLFFRSKRPRPRTPGLLPPFQPLDELTLDVTLDINRSTSIFLVVFIFRPVTLCSL
jgi:hypothetical protein